MSLVLHAVAALLGGISAPAHQTTVDLVDIEVAPPPPPPEALPPEVARPPAHDLADHDTTPPQPQSTASNQPGEGAIDAGIDAAIDARPDAAIDARPDAPLDGAADDGGAPEQAGPPDAPSLADAMTVATSDDRGSAGGGGISDAGHDAGDPATQTASLSAGDAPARGGLGEGSATGSGAPAGSGASDGIALDTAALAAALSAGSGNPDGSDGPAVEGAPTTAGTAANLLTYFPAGHVVTALIRFDRLRGTEWSAQTERLLRPMPDYRLLFGAGDADIVGKLETLVISTPRPRDAAATTLVARTSLARAALRDFLAATTPVTWSTARGGLLGKRTGTLFPGDQRVFLSPWKGWFLLAQPGDLGTLTAAAKGNPDTAVATAKLPPWLAGIRTIERETGEPRGPALVLTLGLPGKRFDLTGIPVGLGVSSIPTPDRVSLAMELVPQGWLLRGNLRFVSDALATEFIASVQQGQQRIADSRTIQIVLGTPIAHVIANLAFARAGPRVSYATSISIADARAILAALAQQIDQYFGRTP
jgi:hypothetical protein